MNKRLLPFLIATGILTSANPLLADDDKNEQQVRQQRKAEYNDPEYRDKYTPYRAYGGIDDQKTRVDQDVRGEDAHRDLDKNKSKQRETPKAQPGRAPAPERNGNRVDRKTEEFSRPLAKTSKMRFEDLPDAVKRTVREQSGGAKIEDVERGTLDGRTVYEIAFKRGNAHNELRVYENGNVLRRMVNPQK